MIREAPATVRAVPAMGGPEAQAVLRDLAVALGRTLDLQGACWHVTDPVSGIPLDGDRLGDPPGDFLRSLEYEFLRADVLRFAALAAATPHAGALALHTGGAPERSPRYREVLAPGGCADELRASFTDRFGTWGTLCLFGRRRFTKADVDRVAATVPETAQRLRAAHAGGAPAVASQTAPGVAVLDGDDRLLLADGQARAWLSQLTGGLAPEVLPGLVHVLSAQARRRDPALPATARARVPDGGWLALDAAPLDDDACGAVSLVVQPAPYTCLLETLLRAHGLTGRERQIASLAIRGRPTKAIAAELIVSPWTVQDHLKSIFDKTGVTSRGQLAALAMTEAAA